MNLQEFMDKTYKPHPIPGTNFDYQHLRPRIHCKDGVSLSVQASRTHYCKPRMGGVVEYSEVEVGYPDFVPPKFWAEYFDGNWNDFDAMHGVYGWVPVELVEKLINAHGGIDVEKTFD